MKKILIPLAFGLLVAGVGGAAYLPQVRARRFLQQVKELRVGSTESQSLLRLRTEFRSNVSVDDPGCTTDRCHIEFTFSNGTWQGLHLAPPIELDAILRTENHVIGYVNLIYRINIRQEISSTVTLFEFGPENGRLFRVDAKPRKPGIIPSMNVRLTDLANEEEKQSAFSFDLSCLSRPFKCRDAYDLAPSLARRGDLHLLAD